MVWRGVRLSEKGALGVSLAHADERGVADVAHGTKGRAVGVGVLSK